MIESLNIDRLYIFHFHAVETIQLQVFNLYHISVIRTKILTYTNSRN